MATTPYNPELHRKKTIYDPLTYQIIGAAMTVHNALGPGMLEATYGDALCVMFDRLHIPFRREQEIALYFQDVKLQHTYRADFVCFDKVIIELKASRTLENIHRAQLLHYLKATQYECGLLLNFGCESLKQERYFN
ncbi:MAG: GxxExxY protein [Prevotella sp.]|nr:GxxExxY protein [Prevotella sp.]